MQPARDVVLLGDSLTEWGSWQAWLPEIEIRNHGVAGETSAEVLRRVRQSVVPAPALLYLLVGVNDLAMGVPQSRIAANVAAITCSYLDVWPALADQHGALAPDFTDDGVHLTATGYAAWLSVLGPDIRRRLRGPRPPSGSAG